MYFVMIVAKLSCLLLSFFSSLSLSLSLSLFFFFFFFNVGVGVTAVCGRVGVVLAVNMTRKALHGKNDMTQQ